jgi:hypothetical protein
MFSEMPKEMRRLLTTMGVIAPEEPQDLVVVGELTTEEAIAHRRLHDLGEELDRMARAAEAKRAEITVARHAFWTRVEDRLGCPSSMNLHLDGKVTMDRLDAEKCGLYQEAVK